MATRDTRKMRKPLMERRRRERINQSLSQLQRLILDHVDLREGARPSKLEKADILEMAVQLLQKLQMLLKTSATVTMLPTMKLPNGDIVFVVSSRQQKNEVWRPW